MKEDKKKSNESRFKNVVISLIVALLMFVGLLFIEAKMITPNGTTDVFVAKGDIEKGTLINESNVDTLFKEKQSVDGELGVTNSIKSREELLNMVAGENINKGAVVAINDFISKDSILSNIQDSVETSLRATDISQVVGGFLREGDLINISVINSVTGESEEVLKNVYVSKAISSDGKEIDRVTDISAMAINVIISKEDEVKLNSKLELGTIRVSKIR